MVNDIIIDVFTFLSRKDLDRLRVVNARFNAIIVGKIR